MTLRQAIATAAEKLRAIESLADTAARDAELLLLHTLRIPRSTIYAYPGRLLSVHEQERYTTAIDRRLRYEPVQYITGVQEFFGLQFEVGPGVLIPRPETELLVEAVLQRLPHDRPVRIVDVGAGSGAIAIALASRLSEASITALDLSAAALEVARRNIRRHGLEHRITLGNSDLLTALPEAQRRLDAVVSNPPYVPETDRQSMHPQVRDYEPEQALFAGDDGLAIYRRLVVEARHALAPGGLLAMEIGYGQQKAITELLEDWRGVAFLDDLQSIPRVVVARRP